MQLKTHRAALRGRLAMATCALLTGSLVHADAAYDDAGQSSDSTAASVKADLGGLYYQEAGGRVNATEGVVNIRSVTEQDNHIGVNLTFDALSGGSPNGALPSKKAQTFSNPSGGAGASASGTQSVPVAAEYEGGTPGTAQTCTTASGVAISCGSSQTAAKSTSYSVPAGTLPLDKTFHDQREAASFSWDMPLSSVSRAAFGGAYSHETDFQSLSVNGGLTRDFNQKNTTLSVGVNLEHDSNNPVGGTPKPLSDYTLGQKQGNGTKTAQSYVLGITQIMTRRWVTDLSLSASADSGYQNDPYKIVSALDVTGNVVGYIYENRPDTRSRRSAFWENRIAFDNDTLDMSLRATQDSWGVASHAADVHYRFELGDGQFIEPQLRWYHQTSANFYRLYVVQGQPYLNEVSADPRLGEFTARTIGLKYGYAFDKDSEFSVRVEKYAQQGVVRQTVLPNLQGLDLYPGLNATIVEADLQFKF